MVSIGRGQVNARKITASGSLAHLRLSTETAEEVLYLSFPNLSLIFPYSLPTHYLFPIFVWKKRLPCASTEDFFRLKSCTFQKFVVPLQRK